MSKDERIAAQKPARKRRRRVFGTIERLPSGRFRARVLGWDGRYVSAPVTFATRTEASIWVDLEHADQVREVWKAPARRGVSPTVGEYVARWITEHPSAKSSTKEMYRGLLRTCIDPTLGAVPLVELTSERVRRWHYDLGERLAKDAQARRASLQARGRDVSPVSVFDGRSRQAQAHRVLRAAMGTAVLDELIDTQPCRIPGAGAPRRALGRAPDLAERLLSPAQVAAVADAMPDRYRALVLAAAWSGLRQGELLALTRADLDLNASPPLVRVRRAVRRSDTGTMQVDLPKTTASLRTVTLPAQLPVAGAEAGPERRLVLHHTTYRYSGDTDPFAPGGIAAVYRDLVADDRLTLVIDDVVDAVRRGRHCLVLTQWTAHVDRFATELTARGHDPVVLVGGMGARARAAAMARLDPEGCDSPLLVVATGPYVGEGFDCPALDTLFLAAPISFSGRLVQYAGRILRLWPGKETAEVHDYVDVPILASSLTKRARGYTSLGFPDPRGRPAQR
jgi:integrase